MPKTTKEKGVHLKVKNEKILDLDRFAPCVKALVAQISDKPINIKQITLIDADKEELIKQTNNPGIKLEVYTVPALESH